MVGKLRRERERGPDDPGDPLPYRALAAFAGMGLARQLREGLGLCSRVPPLLGCVTLSREPGRLLRYGRDLLPELLRTLAAAIALVAGNPWARVGVPGHPAPLPLRRCPAKAPERVPLSFQPRQDPSGGPAAGGTPRGCGAAVKRSPLQDKRPRSPSPLTRPLPRRARLSRHRRSLPARGSSVRTGGSGPRTKARPQPLP
jgi:hypothetical protein